MDFQNDAQKQAYEKVSGMVKELFGQFANARTDIPGFGISYGSAYVIVQVFPWGDNDATITTRSYVVTGAELNQEMMQFLLHANDQMRFGAFGLDKDNDIFYEHTIVASTADLEELKASVMAVVYTADQYDDQIVSRWGGQRASDRK